MYNMCMLCGKVGKYAVGDDVPQKTDRGYYFSDSIIDAVVDCSMTSVPNMLQSHVQHPEELAILDRPLVADFEIGIEESKALIVEALAEFDAELARRANDILGNDDRLKWQQVAPGEAKIMGVTTAGKTRPGDVAPVQDAVIDYDYDGTIGALIYLAHETGHAIADDMQREAGFTSNDNPEHMFETQAYFVQNAVGNFLKDHENPEVAQAAKRFMAADMARNTYDVMMSMAAKDALDAHEHGTDIHPAAIFENRIGEHWQKLLGAYQGGQKIFDAMAALQLSDDKAEAIITLQEEYDRLHYRPSSMITAAGLAVRLEESDEATRRSTSHMLMGATGPKAANEVLARAGVERSDAMDKLAHDAIAEPIAYLSGVAIDVGASISPALRKG